MITTSHVIRRSAFDEPWFKARAAEMLLPAGRRHRKDWELSVIAQVYHEHFEGEPVGIGFGVGLEPLPAWFATRGAFILATDAPGEDPDWKGQHAAGLQDCPRLTLDEEEFHRHVGFTPLDMRHIPKGYLREGFDFLWSTSTFEHIGGIEPGIDFVCQSMAALRPGGLAIHVTEFNPVNDRPTLDAHNICFYREQDLRRLEDRLAAQGDRLWPLDLDLGNDLAERDDENVHQFVTLEPHVATSVLLVIERGGA